MKTCSRCQEFKSLESFSRCKAGLFGVNSICKSCISISDRERRLKNHEEFLKKEREKYWSNPKSQSEKSMKSARKHKDKTLKRNRDYYSKNKDRINELRRLNNLKDPSKKRHTRRKRDASKINATPNWLNKDHLVEIECIYQRAFELEKETGIAHQVDHIIPLNNPKVCGLHVPWNLQVLTASDNSRKQNRFDGTHANLSWVSS